MRVVFHAINGVGLGHLVRATCLAVEMRALVGGSDLQLLVVTNAGDTSLLDAHGLDHVRLPPRTNEPHADVLRSIRALPPPLEEAALLGVIRAFAPDLVVFDTHAPMRVVDQLPRLGARAVLVLRELRPEALASFVRSGAPAAFDRIVVPHDPDEVDLSMLTESAPALLVGPVVRSAPKVAEPVPFTSAPRVVAIAGGGGQPVDAERYVRAVADAHLLARARIPRLETTLVVGPYGTAPGNVEGYDGLSIVRAPPDVPALLARASLVVSQAGYNAIAEIRALEKPAVIVPGHRKAEDQRVRARRLAKLGAAAIAKPSGRSIADAIERILLEPGTLEAMTAAHRRRMLVPKNREAAEAALRPIWRPGGLRPLRVAIVAHDFAPKLGGMETVARSLASCLGATDGIETVRVYTTNRLGARTSSAIEPLYRALPPPLRIDARSDLLATIDMALRDAPDVIHLCHSGLGPWIPPLRAALPVIVTATVHGNDLLTPWVHHGMADEATYRAAQTAGLSAADAVFCVSTFSRELARTAGVAPDVLHTIENGVDPARFHPGDADEARHRLAAKLGLDDGDEIVLTVSRLAPRKGHRTALAAIALLAPRRPRLKYVFTGASETMTAELLSLARELGIASRIVPTGFLPDDELPHLYRLGHVFALLADGDPHDVEGFGIALLEAAATGLPAVGTRTGGIPEAIVDGETGLLVPPNDPALAAEAIERVLDDRALARRLGDRGRRRVVEELTQQRAADRIASIWRELARAPRAAGGAIELVREAQRHGAKAREERRARRATLARAVERGQTLRIRATGGGARLLADALEDAAALGHAPIVEVKLRRFLEPDFAAYALPRVSAIELVHGVPHPAADDVLTKLRAMPRELAGRVRSVRLFLTPSLEAGGRAAANAVTEAHALKKFFSEVGATVVPPPELMRYLSVAPAGAPETAMIEPTNLCNLACPTCPTGTGKIKPLPQMTLRRFDEVLEELAPRGAGRLRNLALWNYGEPLLNRELPQMIAHAKRAGVAVVKVSSNVHFLDGDRGRALLQSGLDVLILSVDGASQETYATFRKEGDFEKVARSVAWLCAERKRLGLSRPRIELQFIVMRHNEHELPAMEALAATWGVDKLRIKTVGADDEGTKALVPASRLLSRYADGGTTPNVRHPFCTMAWDHTVVNVDGAVTPCCYLRPDMGDAFVMGNVFETPFQEIWRGEKYRAFRSAMLDGRAALPVCNRCRGGTHDLVAATVDVEHRAAGESG